MTVLDASGQVMGRFASLVAKRLLNGEEIHVVNAEKALVTGGRAALIAEYRIKKNMGSTASRMRGKGPYYPKRADRILQRVIRGMMPYQTPHGRAAFKRLRVYIGVPSEVGSQAAERVEGVSRVRTAKVLELGEISRRLGAKP